MDDKVYSAPVIKSAIPGGSGVIEGRFSDEEAKDLAFVLRAGSLPAPLKITSQFVVGPTLGADSVRKGTMAALYGLMSRSPLHGRLLPGFRRDRRHRDDLQRGVPLGFHGRHEGHPDPSRYRRYHPDGGYVGGLERSDLRTHPRGIRAGKTIRSAIEAGYSHALTAIIDTHVTTLITSLVLFQFGTGSVKGFAVTLSVGIALSLFTAVVLTKMIFDARKEYHTLSI
jgi:preprotein translocase subunit SecD